MHVITFYSFKGGVGRTMALVNVAAELVRWGRKVLVVDFDLEAPGLETYKHLQPEKPHQGIVEYVSKFVDSRQVPDIREYVFQATSKAKPIGDRGGELWVMPAGRRDRAYRQALVKLNWKNLYHERDGFLFFEETKLAWEQEFKPDYVLVDSRTGDTDVLGICTRQLPDTVVLMFVPNEQNLAGLEGVCRDIRREETDGLQKPIRLHFVAANVPNLDDERGILRRQLKGFQNRLEFNEYSIIRRYESLELLDQSVFVLDRKHSRLARTYRKMTKQLVRDNFADPVGAKLYLQDDAARDWVIDPKDEGHPLTRISGHFLDHASILMPVAKWWFKFGQSLRAERVLDRILTLRPNQPNALFSRAQCKRSQGRLNEAAADFVAYLRSLKQRRRQIEHVLRALLDIAPRSLEEAVDQVAIFGLTEDLIRNADLLCGSPIGIPYAARLFRKTLDGLNAKQRQDIRDELRSYGSCYDQGELFDIDELLGGLVDARCWTEVIDLCGERETEKLPYDRPFYLAIAYWGLTGEMPARLCQQALDQDEDLDSEKKIWALWRVGNFPEAMNVLDDLERDSQGVNSNVKVGISPWSLRVVPKEQMLDDLSKVRLMFQGEPLRPAFLGPLPSS